MIICNGMPKSGTGILMKCMGLMGFDNKPIIFTRFWPDREVKATKTHTIEDHNKNMFYRGHMAYVYPWDDVITIFRDPRNAAVSWVRYFGHIKHGQGKYDWKETKTDLIALILRCGEPVGQRGSFVQLYYSYLGWLDNGFCVFFEDICSDDGKTVKRIADKVGYKGDSMEVYEKLYGGAVHPAVHKDEKGRNLQAGWSTFTGKLSDWEKVWDDDIQRAWEMVSGDMLVYEFNRRLALSRGEVLDQKLVLK